MNTSVDAVIAKYRELRSRKAAIEAEMKKKVAAINQKMEIIEAFLLKLSEQTGVDSFKTDEGTAYVSVVQGATVRDWEATLDYIVKNNRFDLLTRKVSAPAVRQIIEETGDPVPGVDVVEIRKMRFRAPT